MSYSDFVEPFTVLVRGEPAVVIANRSYCWCSAPWTRRYPVPAKNAHRRRYQRRRR